MKRQTPRQVSKLVLMICILPAAPVAAQEGSVASVAFRLPEWQSRHFDDSNSARQYLEVLRKLGCEVTTGEHAGHNDVQMRLTSWKELSLATDEETDSWEAWLRESGFQTLHGHADPAPDGVIVVEYRQDAWQARHFNDSQQADEFVSICRALGCEIQASNHAGHRDIQFRCGRWMHLKCDNHEQAHKLQEWLRQNGFQTQHTH